MGILGGLLGARDRGVHEPDGGRGEFFAQFQGEAGRHRTHVDEHLLRAEGRGRALRAEEQFVNGLRPGDHDDDDRRILGQGLGAGGHPGPQFGQRFGLVGGAVIDR